MFNPNSIKSDQLDSLQQPQDDKKTDANENLSHHVSKCQQRDYNWSEFSELVDNINSEDQFKRYFGIIGIRKLLNEAQYDEDQVQKVIDAGLLARIVEFMKKDDEPRLQVETTWALIGVTRGTFNVGREVIDQGAIPILVRLLKSCHNEVVEHAVAIISNIAYESSDRDILLDHEVLHPLIDVLEEALVKKENTLIKRGTKALSYLCRGSPRPAYERVTDATPIFCRVIQEATDVEVLQDALWALFYLSDGEEEITRVLETDNIVPSLIRCLDCPNEQVILPGLRVLGNVARSDNQADAVLKASLTSSYMKKLFQLLKKRSDKKNIRKEVCWSLSNIACQRDFIHLIVGNPEYVEQLINVALNDILEVQEEALWTLSNAAVWGNKLQLMSMVRNGVFDCMCKSIQQDPPNGVMSLLGLSGIKEFLAATTLTSRKQATNNICLIKLKQKRILDRIKQSKESQDSRVSELALEILKKYLKGHLLKKKLRLKKMVVCFRNEKRHALFGLFQNKKKKLCV